MSPGRPSRAAELGADPQHLAATVFLSLAEAPATAQAAAVALLAVNIGRLVDALEADIASTSTLRFPAPPTLVQS